jgi:hypothetical protein
MVEAVSNTLLNYKSENSMYKCRVNNRWYSNNMASTLMISIFYLDQEEPVAANVDMHFPTPGEHMGQEDHWKENQ